MSKQIHIHAKCQAFEIFEIIPESKAVARLKNIKESFEISAVRNIAKFNDKLFVSTVIINPELPFKN